jgi:hypothetical protein
MFYPFFGFAQEKQNDVAGRVVDGKQMPIPGVAVVMQKLDSTYINAAVSDSGGYFRIASSVRPYRLLFQHLLYQSKSVESSKDNVGAVVLQEKENELSEVQVTASRPIAKVVDGKLSYDIRPLTRNSIVNNAFDLVRKIPGISSDGVKTLDIMGSMNGTSILISGKKTNMDFDQMVSYLKTLPSDRVERVEIVYNAPPEWHVRGAAINVVLKKENRYSAQGQLEATYANAQANTYTGGGSLFLSSPNNSLDLMYTYNDELTRERNIIHSLHTLKSELYDIQSDSRGKEHERYHNLYLDFNHDFSKKGNIEAAYTGKFMPYDRDEGLTSSNLFSDAYSLENKSNYLHDLSLSFAVPFGLSGGVEYTYYKDDGLQDMQYLKGTETTNAFNYTTGQRINHLKAFADMANKLAHDWQLTYGIKYDYTRNKNTQAYEDKQGDGAGDYTTSSKTDEHIADVYIGLKKSLFKNKLNLSASLTGELYKINEYKKNALFPNVRLSYAPTPKHTFQLAYATLRLYPSYWQRQEYTSYDDEYSVRIGNPELKPARYNMAYLLYLLDRRYIFRAAYVNISNFFVDQRFQSQEKLQLIREYCNINYTEELSFMFLIPFNIGKRLSFNLNIQALRDRFKADDWFGLSYDKKEWSALASVETNITISTKPNISFSAKIFYKRPSIQGLWDLGRMLRVNGGANWEIIKGKAYLGFHCNDIFATSYPIINEHYETQNMRFDERFYLRNFHLDFTYKFRGYKERHQKQVNTSRYGM